MYPKTALLLGATGLIGNELLQLLLKDNTYAKVIALSRKPLPTTHPKLENRIVNFSDQGLYREAVTGGDTVFCCVGTTMKHVKGDKGLYRQIDFDIPVNGATYALEKGYTQYALVSAIGASSASSNFYLSLKGQTEDAITSKGFVSTHIFRPSLLLGDRKESRTGENVAQIIMPALSFLMVGSFKKYRAITGAEVAAAMLSSVKTGTTGMHVYTYEEMKTLVKNSNAKQV